MLTPQSQTENLNLKRDNAVARREACRKPVRNANIFLAFLEGRKSVRASDKHW